MRKSELHIYERRFFLQLSFLGGGGDPDDEHSRHQYVIASLGSSDLIPYRKSPRAPADVSHLRRPVHLRRFEEQH